MTDTEAFEQKKAILQYWTLVEFFTPYILEHAYDSKLSHQKIYANESADLAWLTAEVLAENDPTTPFAKGYQLYIGLFSIEETADRARHVFAGRPSQWQSVNWRSCAQASSTTCFARLTVTTHGIPLFGTLSLSTLPWAHGKLLDGKKELVSIEEYWKSVNRLLVKLKEEFAMGLPLRLMKKPKTHARYLDLQAVKTLASLLFDWAGFSPQGYPVVLIEPLVTESTQAAKEPKIETERDVPILNSFYIQDLEATNRSLADAQKKPIDLYLGGAKKQRIILDSREGEEAICHAIRPEKTPAGRWPATLLHKENVMQQFAINAAFESLEQGGIFSINGPPGTGKTALLRQIIAENIVRRAEAFSKLKTAQSAFVRRHAVSFESSDPIYVSELDPSLLGYEMVVVSSNNTAVQNLSRELPLRKELDTTFQEASYLEPVANKLLEGSWGLIAATLGNQENCRKFVESVFTLPSEQVGRCRIWDWAESHQGLSFKEAQEQFIALKNKQEELFAEIETAAFLHNELLDTSIETYCRHECEQLDALDQEDEALTAKLAHLLKEEADEKELLELIQAQEALWNEEKPHAFARMVDRNLADSWSEKEGIIRKRRLAALEQLHACKLRQKEYIVQKQQLIEREDASIEELLDRALFYSMAQDALAALKIKHTFLKLPEQNLEQRASYYQTDEINRVRSQLFIAAMRLHEAWLHEVLSTKGGFRGNLMAVSQLLQGKSPTTGDDTTLCWQSLFLLVPVITSTFASIGRLFRHLEPGALGWLLVDEAGQAVPHAAVGAIWRAERVLSIGDPFQIEPICPIPQEVVDGMAKSTIKDYTLSWAPSQVSVQNLMDRASVFGLERTVRDDQYWLGAPLRVHRRCQEPMFSIANAIAYDESMLLATKAEETTLSASCWYDVSGNTSDRQYVPDQGAQLLQLLKEAFTHMAEPDLYIISPFREVVSQLQQLLLTDGEIKELFILKFPEKSLYEWVRTAVGTVHTFQGKQALAIFFVLGGDKSTLGALEWASRKPNLLNVAVTRAKARFYIIGDYDLWKIWPHFDVAAKKLERKRLVALNSSPM